MTVKCKFCGQDHTYVQYFRGSGYRDVLEYSEFTQTYVSSLSRSYSRRKPLFCYRCYRTQEYKFKKIKGKNQYTLSDITRMENIL